MGHPAPTLKAKYGRLTVIERIPGSKGVRAIVHCRCDCGNPTTVDSSNLLRGITTSCGCRKRECGRENAKALVVPGKGYGLIVPGAVFVRLTVIKREGYKVHCRCSCGNETSPYIDGLVSGNTKSCGCLKKDSTIRRNKENARRKGFSKKYPRTYSRWNSMMSRCYNKGQKAFLAYGGSGVIVCSFLRESPWNLKSVIGLSKKQNPSLDRFPIHNGNYTCGECEECKRNKWELNIRWTTRKGQSENRSNNVNITAFGKTLIRSQWARVSGLSSECIRKRIKRGWTPEEALGTPDSFGNCYRGVVNV